MVSTASGVKPVFWPLMSSRKPCLQADVKLRLAYYSRDSSRHVAAGTVVDTVDLRPPDLPAPSMLKSDVLRRVQLTAFANISIAAAVDEQRS